MQGYFKQTAKSLATSAGKECPMLSARFFRLFGILPRLYFGLLTHSQGFAAGVESCQEGRLARLEKVGENC